MIPNQSEDFLRISSGDYQIGSWNGTNSLAQAPIPAGDVGTWVFLAGVYDGTEWLLYRDGVLDAQSAPTAQGAIQVSSSDWALGASGSGEDRYFSGDIAGAAVWNVPRTAAEVSSDMTSGPTGSEPGLAAYYPLNNIQGATTPDLGPNGLDGTLEPSGYGTQPAATTGPPGIDLEGDGVNSGNPPPLEGPNNLQSDPAIVDTPQGLEGWLAGSVPRTSYLISIYAGAAYAADGSAQAQQYLGSFTVTTDSSGRATFAVPFAAPASLPVITATATDPSGNTSELSPEARLPV